MMRFGQQFVTAFYVLFYLVPCIGFTLIPYRLETPFRVAPPSTYAIGMMVGTYLLFLVLTLVPQWSLARRPGAVARFAAALGRMYSRGRLLFAFGMLAIVPFYLSSNFSGYRYDPQNLSEINSSLLLAVITLRQIVVLDAFYTLFVWPAAACDGGWRERVESMLMAVVLLLLADGTASVVLALATLGHSVSPRFVDRQLFVRRDTPWAFRAVRTTFFGAICVLTFFIAWVSGEMIKNTVTQQQDAATAIATTLQSTSDAPDGARDYALYIVSAVSSYYHALVYTSELPRAALTSDGTWPLMYPLRTLLFRFNYLAGGFLDVPRPEIVSLSRLNYLNTIDLPVVAEREGSSPGVIASFIYLFPLPFNFALCAVFLWWVARIVDVLLSAHGDERLSPIGVLVLLVFLMGVLQSPFDLIAIFDTMSLFVAGLYGIYLVRRHELDVPRDVVTHQAVFDDGPEPLGAH